MMYADYYGEYDSDHGSNSWQKLSDAAEQCGLEWSREYQPHRALADADMARQVMNHMAWGA